MMFQGTIAFLATVLAYGQARDLQAYQENCDFPLPDPGCVCYKSVDNGCQCLPSKFESMSINLADNQFRCTCEMWWLVELNKWKELLVFKF